VVQAIHTAVPGRARYKVEGLYHSQSLKRLLEVRLAEKNGISAISANPLTGNVLVSFNSDSTPTTVAVLIEQVVAEYRNHSLVPLDVNPRQGSKPTGNRGTIQNKVPATRTSVPQKEKFSVSGSFLPSLFVQAEEQKNAAWHLMDAGDVLTAFHSSPASGLSIVAAKRNLETYGPNLLPEAEPRSGWSMLLEQFNSLPVGLLAAAAGISLFTGGLADAVVIMGVVAINATIGYVTESQSEKTIHALKSLVRPSALVIRDGSPHEIRAEEVVVGDILLLRPGSYIAADGRLLEVRRLSVDESALTGESVPVSKITAPLTSLDLPLGDRINMVYMGTLVTGGQGLAVVVATGRYTEIGKIQMLASEAESPKTPMERQLDQMGTQLVYISGGVCALVFGIGLLRGYGFLEMLKSAISLAVAAVPEGLPAVATTTLALGIVNMRKHQVLIRRLDAVETLGCVQTICLDKTGTLTLNKMSVVSAYSGMRRIRVADDSFSVGEEYIDPLACEELVKLAQVCVLCSETEIEKQGEHYVLRGSPTENALVHMAISAGVDIGQLREACPALQISHRAENRNFMSTLHGVNGSCADSTGSPFFIAVKGSPTEVLAMCDWQIKGGERIPLSENDRLIIETENERMAGEALRVLGCAYSYVEDEGKDAPVLQGLTWLGLVGMTDPIRRGVKEVIDGFHQAGIDTVMITGDQSPTAYAIGKELNLSCNGQLEILDSTHLANVDPEVMKALASKVDVFARVSPAHKLQIVQALQRAGKVVAMTGDGINDGPALKAADIGIAMGNTGTDVAREVADVILENDNLQTMIVAISQGRTIYTNIRKSVHFLLSTNMSEIMVMFTAIAAGLGQPLNAMQLLWINLISDIFPGLALALEPPEPEVLSQTPRNPEEPIIKPSDFKRIAFESATLSAGALGAYGYGLMRYGMGPQAGTLAFTSLTSGQLLHAVTSRSETHSVLGGGREGEPPLPPNPYLNVALIGSFAAQALVLVMPGLRNLLGLAPLTLLDGLVIGGSTLLPFVVNEKTKTTRVPRRDRQEAEGKEKLLRAEVRSFDTL
jgi:Ca2+-transporting ATPase